MLLQLVRSQYAPACGERYEISDKLCGIILQRRTRESHAKGQPGGSRTAWYVPCIEADSGFRFLISRWQRILCKAAGQYFGTLDYVPSVVTKSVLTYMY